MIEHLQEFKAECRTLGMEKHTIESYLSNLRQFFGYINKPPLDIKTFDLAHFLNYLRFEKQIKYRGGVKVGCAKSTIKTYFSSINAYYDFLEFNGLIENNPVTRFRKRYLRHVKKEAHRCFVWVALCFNQFVTFLLSTISLTDIC